MFKKHKVITLFMLLLTNVIIPLNVFAYSDYILAGGDNIGIELNSSGVIIVGTYDIGNESPARDANLKAGDKIIKINDNKVSSISEMLDYINNNQTNYS